MPLKNHLYNYIFTYVTSPYSIRHSSLVVFWKYGIWRFLSGLGIDFVFTVKGIVAAQVFVNIPYMVKILRTAIEAVNPKMEFIARTLGSNSIKAFFYITLPLIKNGLIASVVMTWSKALGNLVRF